MSFDIFDAFLKVWWGHGIQFFSYFEGKVVLKFDKREQGKNVINTKYNSTEIFKSILRQINIH